MKPFKRDVPWFLAWVAALVLAYLFGLGVQSARGSSTGNISLVAFVGTGGGSALTLDLADDGADESVSLSEIATTNDTGSVWSEPTPDKLLFDGSSLLYESELSTSANLSGLLSDETGTGVAVFDTQPLFSGYLDLSDIAAPAAPGAGTLRLWSETEGGHSFVHVNNSADLDRELGRDLVHVVRNNTGVQIDKCKPVYISGSTGTIPEVSLAKADAEATMPVFAVTAEDIATASFGLAFTAGDITCDTSGFLTGDVLYVSAATAGNFTTTKPVGDNLAQRVASVTNSGVGNGILTVEIGASLGPVTSLGSTCTDDQVLGGTAAGTGVECQAAGGGGGDRELYWSAPALHALEHTGDNIAPPSKREGTNVDVIVRAFDDTTEECVGGTFLVPGEIDTSGTVTFRAVWYAATAPSPAEEVVWSFRHLATSDAESWDQALTQEDSSAESAKTTQDQETHSTWTETAATLGWAGNDSVKFELCREPGTAGDDLVGDAHLISFSVEVPRS